MYQVPQHIDNNKIFIVQKSEIVGRLDPKMVLYNRKVQHSIYPKFPLRKLLTCKPQYGAGESGIIRTSLSEPRYIRITDINDDGLISTNELGATAQNVEDKYILNENDILIARSGSVGKTYIHKQTPYECFFAGYLIRFIINPKLAIPDYIFAYTQLNAYKEWVNAISRPSVQSNINSAEYQSLEIPLPSIAKQQELVDIIKSAYISKQQKEFEAQQLLDSIDTYLFEELGMVISQISTNLTNRIVITNFKDIVDTRMDPYYTMYVNHEYQSTKFENVPLGRIAHIVKGTALTSKEVISGNIPVIAGGQTVPYHHNVSNFVGNVITVSASGAYAGFVWYHTTPIFATDCSVVYSKDETKFLTAYIYEVLRYLQAVIYRLQVGAAQPYVYPTDLMNIQIPCLPIEQQKSIVERTAILRQQAKDLHAEGKAILENAKKDVERMIMGESS